MPTLRLHKTDAALLVIDVQERLCAAMVEAALPRLVNRTVAAITGARALSLPVVVTEQYPRGLGHTLPAVRAALGEAHPVEKVRFTAALEPVLGQLGDRKQVLVVGMETHVCVYQTVRDLAARGLSPVVLADAVISRTAEDRQVGLALCKESGALITSVEAALFDLLGTAEAPEFKAVSAAVK